MLLCYASAARALRTSPYTRKQQVSHSGEYSGRHPSRGGRFTIALCGPYLRRKFLTVYPLRATALTTHCARQVLWGVVGQTLVDGLIALKHNTNYSISPSLAVPPAEIIITASLNRVLDAMEILKDRCPLIGTSCVPIAGHDLKSEPSRPGISQASQLYQR